MNAPEIMVKIMLIVMLVWLVTLVAWIWIHARTAAAVLTGILLVLAAAVAIILIFDAGRFPK